MLHFLTFRNFFCSLVLYDPRNFKILIMVVKKLHFFCGGETFIVDSLGQGAPFKNGQLHFLIRIHIQVNRVQLYLIIKK